MKLLVAGCSFSSGWGLASPDQGWSYLLAQRLASDLDNRAQASMCNAEIFLQALDPDRCFDVIVVQWTALARISLSPSPVNPSIVASHPNAFFDAALPGISSRDLRGFHKIMSLVNGDWKHYFQLISMIEVLQKDPRVVFVNGLLHWDHDFFAAHWTMPMPRSNSFIEHLLNSDQLDDDDLEVYLDRVIEARDRIDQSRWVNLTHSWQTSKIDQVSDADHHPGIKSQRQFCDQVYNFIKEHHA